MALFVLGHRRGSIPIYNEAGVVAASMRALGYIPQLYGVLVLVSKH